MTTISYNYTTSQYYFFEPKKSLYEYINLATLNFIGNLISLFPFLQKNSGAYILCYHSVSNSGWRFSTGIKEFEDQIAFLAQNYNVISLQELLEGKKGICITFDDGYEDIYTNALPILKKYGMTATVFVIGNNKNPNREKMQNNLLLLNLSQILVLKDNGWDIGFHTQTHPNLIELTDEKLHEEIITGKIETETKLGIDLDYFAYPLGLYNKKILSIVAEAGYKAAFTVNGGQANTKKLLQIDRIGVEGNISLHQFKAFISPLGLFVSKQFMKLLQLKELILNYF